MNGQLINFNNMNTFTLEGLKEASKNKHNSQFGETGVIDYILRTLDIEPKECIEFGSGAVSKFRGTANIRYFHDQYKANCIYFETNRGKIQNSDPEYRNQINIEAISFNNVNDIFKKYNVSNDLDVVVIDVDGQDYWIWEALDYTPKIILIEFNPTLPYTDSIVMHKDENHFQWRNTNCLYYGASISALEKLGDSKNYNLLYKTERNLIFIRKDLTESRFTSQQLHPQPLKDFRNTYINQVRWVTV